MVSPAAAKKTKSICFHRKLCPTPEWYEIAISPPPSLHSNLRVGTVKNAGFPSVRPKNPQAFVGGSLVPKGGQNLLEPAAWGCPVIYGPHTDNFEEARITLESHGGSQEVKNGKDLAEAVNLLFEQPLKREKQGRGGRSALEALAKGVATKQTDILLQVLEARN